MSTARRTLLGLLAVCLVLLATGRPALAASPRIPVLGIADQKTEMFSDPLFQQLGVRHARIVVPWDAMDGGFQEEELRTWMRAAQAAGVTPLVSFGHSRKPGRSKLAPAPSAFQRQFRRVRVNFPWVTEFVTWNEPNHCSQPLCHKPRLAARYFDAISRACPSCTILGGEVLDQPNMAKWVTSFRRAARHEPKAWGLHNYLDTNRLRTSGTRALLRASRGQVWFTETGGIVARKTRVKIPFEESAAHAATATRWLFDRLAALSPRIRRIYLYHWNPSGPGDEWDSALVNLHGQARAAYRVVLARVQRAAAASRSAAPTTRR